MHIDRGTNDVHTSSSHNVCDNVGYISATGKGNCYITADLSHTKRCVIKMLCDTGATASAIGDDLYTAYLSHLPLQKKNTIVKGFTGGEVTSPGTVNLKFKLGDKDFCHDFLVVPHVSHQAILGIDFLSRFEGNLNVKDNVLQLHCPDGSVLKVPLLSIPSMTGQRKVSINDFTILPP